MRKRDSINSIISDMSFDEYELDVDRRNVKLFEEKNKPLHKVCFIWKLKYLFDINVSEFNLLRTKIFP